MMTMNASPPSELPIMTAMLVFDIAGVGGAVGDEEGDSVVVEISAISPSDGFQTGSTDVLDKERSLDKLSCLSEIA
jgi:hypothetical protein